MNPKRAGAAGSRDDLLSRLASVHDDNPSAPGTAGQMLTSYTFNGVNRIVREQYPQPSVKLDYIGDTPGVYAGFDRFGRVQDQNWRTPSGSSVDRFNYGHDFNGNRTYRRNVLAEASLTPKDWAYGYDAFDQLTAANRGRLQDPPSGQLVANSTNSQQSWTLDLAGNWAGFKSGAGAGWTLDQTRSNNLVNEITNITATTGSIWVTPAYDARGNMTQGPQPGIETNRLHFVYDAWNRLVQVNSDSNGVPGAVIATYRFDAANQRIAKLLGTNPTSPDTSYDYYYNNSWQLLETRKNSNLYEQYVWSVRYLDAPVLRDRDADAQSYNGLEERLFYTGDAHFNVTALINTAGEVVERYEYDPYGKFTVLSPDFTGVRPASLYGNEVLFSGYRFDSETGLYYVRYRMYHPTLGVWTTRDPIADPEFRTLNQWPSRDPIGEVGFQMSEGSLPLVFQPVSPLALAAMDSSSDTVRGGAPYLFVGNAPCSMIDPLGLQRKDSSELRLFFDDPGHWRTAVGINFYAGEDSGRNKGDCPCASPKLAQVVRVVCGNALCNLIFGTGGKGELDTKRGQSPWYPYQLSGRSQASMRDRPGPRWFNATSWLYRVTMDFETCALCTDDGVGKFWVISCVNWGIQGGGLGTPSRYGDGVITGRGKATAFFLSAFPQGQIGG
ncbi:MAG: hypothetical protein NTV49_04650 [Kiritimatiellaeota bacterium]|nr:hypothetical protein [Kiritimatiellota bacterium]